MTAFIAMVWARFLLIHRHLRPVLTLLLHGPPCSHRPGFSTETRSLCPTLLAPSLRHSQCKPDHLAPSRPLVETPPLSLVFCKAMRLGLRTTPKFSRTTSAWTLVTQMLVLLCEISFDGFTSLIYKVTKGYGMEVRHQTAVTYTSKISFDGP